MNSVLGIIINGCGNSHMCGGSSNCSCKREEVSLASTGGACVFSMSVYSLWMEGTPAHCSDLTLEAPVPPHNAQLTSTVV